MLAFTYTPTACLTRTNRHEERMSMSERAAVLAAVVARAQERARLIAADSAAKKTAWEMELNALRTKRPSTHHVQSTANHSVVNWLELVPRRDMYPDPDAWLKLYGIHLAPPSEHATVKQDATSAIVNDVPIQTVQEDAKKSSIPSAAPAIAHEDVTIFAEQAVEQAVTQQRTKVVEEVVEVPLEVSAPPAMEEEVPQVVHAPNVQERIEQPAPEAVVQATAVADETQIEAAAQVQIEHTETVASESTQVQERKRTKKRKSAAQESAPSQTTLGGALLDAIVEGVDTSKPLVSTSSASEPKDTKVVEATTNTPIPESKKTVEKTKVVDAEITYLVDSGKVKNLTVTKLRRLLSASGLKTSGRKSELIARLTSFAKAK